MKVDGESADRVVDAVAERLPAGVRIKRRGRARLIVISSRAGFERASRSVPVFGNLPAGTRPGAAVEIVLREVITEVTAHLDSEDMTWPGLQAGPVAVAIQEMAGALVASVTDQAGHIVEFPPVPVPEASPEDLAADASAQAVRAELAGERSEVDSLALWLLRIGIDQTGELELNRLWDVAVRAMVIADLHRSGRLSEAEDTIQVGTEATGVAHEDIACQQLLAQPALTEHAWIQTGRLRSADVATHLVATSEWSARRSPFSVGRRKYCAAKQQYLQLTRRLGHTYDGEFGPLSDAEAALAVLGHALNIVRPQRLTLAPASSSSALQPQDCGVFAAVTTAAVTEIRARIAANFANSNPTVM
jgi:hypothetical protein